jgi:hypothetical protein
MLIVGVTGLREIPAGDYSPTFFLLPSQHIFCLGIPWFKKYFMASYVDV